MKSLIYAFSGARGSFRPVGRRARCLGPAPRWGRGRRRAHSQRRWWWRRRRQRGEPRVGRRRWRVRRRARVEFRRWHPLRGAEQRRRTVRRRGASARWRPAKQRQSHRLDRRRSVPGIHGRTPRVPRLPPRLLPRRRLLLRLLPLLPLLPVRLWRLRPRRVYYDPYWWGYPYGVRVRRLWRLLRGRRVLRRRLWRTAATASRKKCVKGGLKLKIEPKNARSLRGRLLSPASSTTSTARSSV